jgi:hypothetical protein
LVPRSRRHRTPTTLSFIEGRHVAMKSKPVKIDGWKAEIAGTTREYLHKLPREPLPPGSYLVHNHVVPARRLGDRGFRAWVQQGGEDGLVECDCDFGGTANSKINRHYRVRMLTVGSA